MTNVSALVSISPRASQPGSGGASAFGPSRSLGFSAVRFGGGADSPQAHKSDGPGGTRGGTVSALQTKSPPAALPAIVGKYVSVTSYRRDGTAVATPMWF